MVTTKACFSVLTCQAAEGVSARLPEKISGCGILNF